MVFNKATLGLKLNKFKMSYFVLFSAFTEEERTGLTVHNKFRQVHQAPPMTLDRQMCDDAEAYAKKLAAMGTLVHSPRADRKGHGENLSMGCSTNAAQSMEEAVTNW